MNLKPISLAAALATTAAASPALAYTAPLETVRATVAYDDLDISQPAGATALLQRITVAAERLCRPDPSVIGSPAAFRACVDGAVSNAVATVNQPLLTELHSGQAAIARK